MKYFICIVCVVLFLANCDDSPQTKQSTDSFDEGLYTQKGKKIATATFATLAMNLQKALKEGGVKNAVGYCNIAASPLVDSLQQVYNADIKRTSLKIRNSNNKPTTDELKQLNIYQKQTAAGQSLKPVVQKMEDHVQFYAPIHAVSLCLKCHGTVGEELLAKDYEHIQKLYPDDMAVGFKDGDLRGIWSIRLK